MNSLKTTISAIVVSCALPVVFADHRQGLGNSSVKLRTFSEVDRNGNGFIEASEWPDYRQLFTELDTNRDGRLSKQEYFDRGDQYDRVQRFRDWDTNQNGRLEGPEWKSDPALFHQLDRDEDSVISLQEFSAHDINQRFREFDRNNDGRINAREWNGDQNEFRRLDGNSDGWLSPEEYFARGDYGERTNRFRSLDTNRNGVLEGNEWRAPERLFHEVDANRDGRVSMDEYVSMNPGADRNNDWWQSGVWNRNRNQSRNSGYPGISQEFRNADRDNDGYLSANEWTGNRAMFRVLDEDRDGRLSPTEFGNTNAAVQELDYNRDGRITRDEWRGNQRSFREADANRDGSLDSAEVGNYVRNGR